MPAPGHFPGGPGALGRQIPWGSPFSVVTRHPGGHVAEMASRYGGHVVNVTAAAAEAVDPGTPAVLAA